MSNKPIGADVHDPYNDPPSKRYTKYNACQGLIFEVTEEEKVLNITLNRPSKVNSITQAMYNTLHCEDPLGTPGRDSGRPLAEILPALGRFFGTANGS